MHPNAPFPQGRDPHVPPPTPAGATGELILTIEGSPVTGSVVAPKVRVGLAEHDTHYGANHFQVPVGRHQVEVFASWMSRAAEARTQVEVPPGGSVQLYYSAPTFPGGPSRLGPEPHRRRGAKLLTVLLCVMLALMAFVLAGMLIWG